LNHSATKNGVVWVWPPWISQLDDNFNWMVTAASKFHSVYSQLVPVDGHLVVGHRSMELGFSLG
jgi:hypothetical protein